MGAIARFVGVDLRSIRPNAKILIVPVAMVGVPVLLLLGPYMLIPAISAVAFITGPSYLFGHDDHGRLDTLYTALGIRRHQVVAGRYATCLLLLIALTIAGVLLASVVALALGAAFDWAIAAALAGASVAFNGVSLAVELPAYFGTGPGLIRFVAGMPPAMILTAVLFVWAFHDDRAVLLSRLAHANVVWFTLAAVAITAVLGAASTALSARLYARRDL
jgi:hypothetical protein